MNNQPDQKIEELLKEKASVQFESIDLRFHYSKKISEEHLKNTAERLNDWMKREQHDIPVDSITFIKKHSALPDEVTRRVIAKWRSHVQRQKMQNLAVPQALSDEGQISPIDGGFGLLTAKGDIETGLWFPVWEHLLDLILNGIKFCCLGPWNLLFDRKSSG
jgi:hypothetical protein